MSRSDHPLIVRRWVFRHRLECWAIKPFPELQGSNVGSDPPTPPPAGVTFWDYLRYQHNGDSFGVDVSHAVGFPACGATLYRANGHWVAVRDRSVLASFDGELSVSQVLDALAGVP